MGNSGDVRQPDQRSSLGYPVDFNPQLRGFNPVISIDRFPDQQRYMATAGQHNAQRRASTAYTPRNVPPSSFQRVSRPRDRPVARSPIDNLSLRPSRVKCVLKSKSSTIKRVPMDCKGEQYSFAVPSSILIDCRRTQ